MSILRRMGVFCGSSAGARPEYTEAATALADALVSRDVGLVYGGGRVGLMGRVAEAVLEQGGEAIGVIPDALGARELAHAGLSDLRVVSSMAERKAVMAELSDAFIALPGGFGTIDELFEMLTWTQLGIQAKPCGILNVSGYYDAMLGFLDHSVAEDFVHPEHRAMVVVETSPKTLVDRLASHQNPVVDKAREGG